MTHHEIIYKLLSLATIHPIDEVLNSGADWKGSTMPVATAEWMTDGHLILPRKDFSEAFPGVDLDDAPDSETRIEEMVASAKVGGAAELVAVEIGPFGIADALLELAGKTYRVNANKLLLAVYCTRADAIHPWTENGVVHPAKPFILTRSGEACGLLMGLRPSESDVSGRVV